MGSEIDRADLLWVLLEEERPSLEHLDTILESQGIARDEVTYERLCLLGHC